VLDFQLNDLCVVDIRVWAVKDDVHLLQRVTSSFWVEEEDGDAVGEQDKDKDKVVLPANSSQSNWVDKDVKDNGNHLSDPAETNSVRTEVIWPDFSRISNLEWCTVKNVS
jgi:hypothetical protein